MRCLKLVVAYDGTSYHGWQRQENAITVQQVLEEKLSHVFAEKINLVASGRTDAKVHALGQVVSFTTSGKIPLENIGKATNAILPNSIVVISAHEVASDFHARFDAKGKTYQYKIIENERFNPFTANYAWLLGEKLDLKNMQKAADMILGEHDFSSFQATGSTPTVPVRKMTVAKWQKNEQGEVSFTVSGNGFLYHMVRNLVGTMVDVGLGKMTPTDFQQVLIAKNRKKAGKTAPAQGLYLCEVFYEGK